MVPGSYKKFANRIINRIQANTASSHRWQRPALALLSGLRELYLAYIGKRNDLPVFQVGRIQVRRIRDQA